MQTVFTNFLKKIDWKLTGFFLLSIVICIPLILLNDFPTLDVAHRYAPAAEAFARGDWKYAFHPRLQSFHQIFAGCFTYLFSTDGFMGAKLSSMLFFAFGIFPLFYLLKEVFHKKIAYWGIFAYAFASRLLVYAYSGLRDSHKQFAIILLTLGLVYIYKYRTQLRGYVITGIACGCAVCIRNDMILFAVILFMAGAILDAYKNVLPWRSLISGVTAFIFSLPELLINYKLTGYMIPGSRFYTIFVETCHYLPTCSNVLLATAGIFLFTFAIFLPVCGWVLRRKYGKTICLLILFAGIALVVYKICSVPPVATKKAVSKFFQHIFRGLFPIIFFLMLPGLLYRIWKKMTKLELILLSVYILQTLIVIFQIYAEKHVLYVDARYLLPATPMFFGWFGVSAMLVWKIFSLNPEIMKYRKAVSYLLITAFIILAIYDMATDISYLYWRGKYVSLKKNVHEIAEIIRADYKGIKYKDTAFEYFTYKSNRCPRIWFSDIDFKYTIAAYFSGGIECPDLNKAEYAVTIAEKKLPKNRYQKVGRAIQAGKDTIQVWKKKKISGKNPRLQRRNPKMIRKVPGRDRK